MRPVSRPFRLHVSALSTVFAVLLAATAAAQPAPAHHAEPHPTAPKPRAHQHPPAQHRAPTHAQPHPAAPPSAPAKPPEPNPAPQPAAPDKGSATGLPLPRFVSLRTDDVNFRAGPGTRYPVEWVYRRRDLPVEIEREFDVWRLVRDPQNNRGWVHTATLSSRRTIMVTGDAAQSLRSAARDDAALVAKLEPGVVGRLRSCQAASDWCQVQVKEYKGWMRRKAFWGTLPGEAVQ